MKKRVLSILLILFLSVNLCGCFISGVGEAYNSTLQSIIYGEEREESEYTVMIKEENEYVPYLVLTNNYYRGGDCLLLRKNLIDERMRYNANCQAGAYYPESEVDEFLNDEFIKVFSQEIQSKIADTEIQVTTKDGILYYEKYTEKINRKIFLLSFDEVTMADDSLVAKEGMFLNYFHLNENRIALNEEGQPAGWWLRSPNIRYDITVMTVSYDGMCLYTPCGSHRENDPDYQLGVRPAFCLPRDTKIVEVDGVYYIEADYNAVDVMDMAEDRSRMLYEEISVPSSMEERKPIDDIYRAEDYDAHIKPALSIVMEAHKDDPDYLYHVAMYSVMNMDLKEELFYINNNSGVYLNDEYWREYEEPLMGEGYYYVFTAAEIEQLVGIDMSCHYVGSGDGSLEKANWDTTEGLLEYCELYGDGYVAK